MILLNFSLFIEINVKKFKNYIYFDKNEIISLFPFKELFDLIISKISSDGGDFPRTIEIALLRLCSSLVIRCLAGSMLCANFSVLSSISSVMEE